MKNKNPLEKAMNAYDLFVDAILSLPFDVRKDVLNIADKNSNNSYLYLFKRIQKQNPEDPIYSLLIENGALTSEMLQHA
jgi:hypothetical protein